MEKVSQRLEAIRERVRHNSGLLENFQDWDGVFEEFDALIESIRSLEQSSPSASPESK